MMGHSFKYYFWDRDTIDNVYTFLIFPYTKIYWNVFSGLGVKIQQTDTTTFAFIISVYMYKFVYNCLGHSYLVNFGSLVKRCVHNA